MGAAMGFTPRDVDSMGLWELRACAEGFRKPNGGEDKVPPPSDAEDDYLRQKYG